MARFELRLPKMGESVAEATITNWLKNVGDTIDMDEPVLEIATDKVDSEVPSEVSGVLVEQLFSVDDVVEVGAVLAVIETDQDSANSAPAAHEALEVLEEDIAPEVLETVRQPLTQTTSDGQTVVNSTE
ncbi:MAG: 2-oxo acid dehydrogenase subunit E2, partial [Bacteroidetes bacterium]|nr:2-oxo acid dehydrogenase subunit E2 [Bacteroidota bacterium]